MELQGSKGCNLIFIWRIWCCGYESGDVGLRFKIAGIVVLVSCLRAPRPEKPTAIRHESISSHTSSHRGQKAYFMEPTGSNTSPLGNHPQRWVEKYCFTDLLSGCPWTEGINETLIIISWTLNTPHQSSALVSINLAIDAKLSKVCSLCKGLQLTYILWVLKSMSWLMSTVLGDSFVVLNTTHFLPHN